MAKYRVKRIKHRPVDSRERIPSEVDALGGKVFVFFGAKPQWKPVSLHVVLAWVGRYNFYWAPARSK